MTAEIAIMNKEAVALAADSAVTVTGATNEKIFASANKLFALSKYHPVGIMVYGQGTFMGIPWEAIVKIYRHRLGKKSFETIGEHAAHFISFLESDQSLFPESIQNEYIKSSLYGYFEYLKDAIEKEIKKKISNEGQITEEQVKEIVSKTIRRHFNKWEKAKNIDSIPSSFNEDIIAKHEQTIANAIKDVFEELPISDKDAEFLKKNASYLFSRFTEEIQHPEASGVVIAGFGDKETFPSLVSYDLEMIVNDKLKHRTALESKIDFEMTATIIPFAQREMVDIFMAGVDPSYLQVEESYLTQMYNEYLRIIIDNLDCYNDTEKRDLTKRLIPLTKKVLEDHGNNLREYRRRSYIDPVIGVVSILPKDELAVMAETLVNLTSFKRKVTMESETVSGPIDVAVISKGDGFIWIKRKHYFDAKENPQFFSNYFREVSDEEIKG
jgi:hypothetical protein